MTLKSLFVTLLTLTTLSFTTHAIVLNEQGQCRVLGFFPTEVDPSETTDPFTRWSREETLRVSRSMMAAATLAVEHFHNRDTTLVPQLANLPKECSVELDLDIVTEHVSRKRAGQIMVEEAQSLCAFLGTYDPDVARAMQPTSVALDLPQVIFYTLDQFLTSSKRPSAIGLPPTVLPHTRGLAEYLNAGQVIPPRKFLQLVYQEAYTSSYFSQCFEEDAAQKFGLKSEKYQDDHLGIIPTQTPEELQRKILQEVKDSGVKTIFLNKIDSRGINLTAHILADYDMLTDEYLYVFQPHAIPTDAVGTIFGGQKKDSPLDRLLRGGLILDHHDPFRAHPETDPFLHMWKQQGPYMVDKILEKYPQFGSSFTEESRFFQDTMPADYAAFLYDAIIAIGMGACYATTEKALKNDTKPFRNDIQAYNFTGATGSIEWGCYKSNRCNQPLKFGIFNIQAIDNGDGTNDYKTVATAEWTEEERWQKLADNVYRDGSTIPQTDLREEWEANYLSKGARGFGVFLFASAALVSLLGLFSLWYLGKDRLMVRSQPLFLAIMCVGSLLMACSILTLQFDESSLGGSISAMGLDCACSLSVWFFFVGHVLSFAALVSKTRRLDNVMRFRKGNIMSSNQAMVPLLVLVGLTILILIIWSAVDPWVWKRDVIMLNPFETYGSCQSEHFWAFFGPLMGLLTTVEGVALFFVWKTMDVNDDYSDTSSTLLAMSAQLQAWVIGVPILTVLNNGDNANAVYLGRALLIWMFSVSGVAFVVGKKAYAAIQQRLYPEEENHLHISGILTSTNASSGALSTGFNSSRSLRRPSTVPKKKNSLIPTTSTCRTESRNSQGQDQDDSNGRNRERMNGSAATSISSPFSLDSLHLSLGGMTMETATCDNSQHSRSFAPDMLELLEAAGGKFQSETENPRTTIVEASEEMGISAASASEETGFDDSGNLDASYGRGKGDKEEEAEQTA